MVYVVIEHAFEVLLLIQFHRLDNESAIPRKKEEGAALPRALTGIEHILPILVQVQRSEDVLRCDVIHFHQLAELFLMVRGHLHLLLFFLLNLRFIA